MWDGFWQSHSHTEIHLIDQALAGTRFTPGSSLDSVRYAKDLAWLVKAPLADAKEILATVYGFTSWKDLSGAISLAGSSDAAGPFDTPRPRPAFFEPQNFDDQQPFEEATPVTARERALFDALVRYRMSAQSQVGGISGLRRVCAAMDAGFFCDAATQRLAFAQVKQGIEAVEGTFEKKEDFLERNWPPGFWAYLDQMAYAGVSLDDEALRPLLLAGTRFDDQTLPIFETEMRRKITAHRAPEVFLAMAGPSNEARGGSLPDPTSYFDDFDDDEMQFPRIQPIAPGLFVNLDYDAWFEFIDELWDDKSTCPSGPAEVLEGPDYKAKLTAARGQIGTKGLVGLKHWRLHELRRYAERYVKTQCFARLLLSSGEAWPSAAHQVQSSNDSLAFQARRPPAAWLCIELYLERTDLSAECDYAKAWKFSAVALKKIGLDDTRVEFVGRLNGLVLNPVGEYVESEESLELAGEYGSDAQSMLIDAFLHSYLPSAGYKSLVKYVNRDSLGNNAALTQIELAPAFRGQGLGAHVLRVFCSMFSGMTSFGEHFSPWRSEIQFDDELDPSEIDEELEAGSPGSIGAVLIPVERQNLKLARYLRKLDVENEDFGFGDGDFVDVFTFDPEEVLLSDGK